MKYEGVTFVEEAAKGLTKEAFIRAHIGNFWLDRDKETRKKMLADVFGRITEAKKK
jgi:hypothetical protein